MLWHVDVYVIAGDRRESAHPDESHFDSGDEADVSALLYDGGAPATMPASNPNAAVVSREPAVVPRPPVSWGSMAAGDVSYSEQSDSEA